MSAILLPVVTQDVAGNFLVGGRYVPRILAASAVAVSCPADTTEDILATITVPAGAMGLNGILRVTANWSFTNSVNNKSMRVRFGGIGGTQYYSVTTTTTQNIGSLTIIQNRGAANSQVGWQGGTNTQTFSGFAAAPTTSAVDTAAATTIVLTGQKATAGETLTLESYLVELILP